MRFVLLQKTTLMMIFRRCSIFLRFVRSTGVAFVAIVVLLSPLDCEAAVTLGLVVDAASGSILLVNNSTGPISIRGYEVTSALGSLDVTANGWTSLAAQGLGLVGGGNKPGESWQEGGNPSPAGFFEGFLLGGTILPPSQALSLGRAYDKTVNAQDLVFQYRRVDTPGVIAGTVQYVLPPSVIGDYDADFDVDGADFLRWQRTLGTAAALPNDATPGSVTAADLVAWKASFGSKSSAPATVAVPEPGTIVLVLAGGSFLAIVSKRQRRVLAALLIAVLSFAETPQLAQAQAPPAPHGVLPSQLQLNWQAEEFYAFIHFGPNTYTDEEWGYSQQTPDVFNPTDLDTDAWAKAIADAGMKGMMLTAKHHDGMALWDTTTTQYKITNSQWAQNRIAQGLDTNVVRMAAESAKKYGLKFGIYVSPWDMHVDPAVPKPQLAGTIYDEPQIFGDDTPGDYNAYFRTQLTEVLTMKLSDGSPIELFEFWLDGAKGTDTFQTYEYAGVRELIRQYQPNAALWGFDGDIRWSGNEDGYIDPVSWHRGNNGFGAGARDGWKWQPAEANGRIRTSWFYRPEEDPRSPEALMEFYLKTVGRSANIALNVAPNRAGGIDQKDVDALMAFKGLRDGLLNDNLLSPESPIVASAVRGGNNNLFGPQKVLDGQVDTYWTMNDNQTTGFFEIDLGALMDVKGFVVQEHIALGQRIGGYAIDVMVDGAYQTVVEGVSLGYQRIDALDEPIATRQVRFRVTQADAVPLIQSFRVLGDVAPDSVGDLDLNGSINRADWECFLAGIGLDLSGLSSLEAFRLGDMNRDKRSDLVDFDLFVAAFDAANGAGAFAAAIAVPEPGAILLTAIGGAFLVRRASRLRTRCQ